MRGTQTHPLQLFRIWIAVYENWRPTQWNDVPPRATALEIAETHCLSTDEAQTFLEGFNRRMLNESKQLWAVALPIALYYAGDADPGDSITGYRFEAEQIVADDARDL